MVDLTALIGSTPSDVLGPSFKVESIEERARVLPISPPTLIHQPLATRSTQGRGHLYNDPTRM